MEKNIQALQSACVSCHVPQEIKDELCYLCAAQHMVQGKWKLLILWSLRDDVKRFSALHKQIPNVKQGPLTEQLKELAASGLIYRKSYNEVPPRVEYGLTDKGKSFIGVLEQMDIWARQYLFA